GEKDTHKRECECGNFETGDCNSTLTPDSATTHKVYCSVCNDVQAEGVTCEFGDWAHVDGEKDTHKRECECGNVETGDCEFGIVDNEDGTHSEVCGTCEYVKSTVACTFTVVPGQSADLGVGDALEVECICGNHGTLMIGDVNDDGEITLVDVVLILRVAAGMIDESAIDMNVADTTAPADPTNTVDTADAVKVLRFLLAKKNG
ncbi:MAG: dockerin type I repeat-containing protein, partial [Clostridia bacterium]|nr:dockerin type I repeat-containing protein [Clostridia bacterium]